MAAKTAEKAVATHTASRGKREWRGVVLETKKNYTIEATTEANAKKEMRKVTGLPEHDKNGTNWVVGLP
jgi:hypothetical protein